jgi:hypothetical protein
LTTRKMISARRFFETPERSELWQSLSIRPSFGSVSCSCF